MATHEFRKDVTGYWGTAPPFAGLTQYTYHWWERYFRAEDFDLKVKLGWS